MEPEQSTVASGSRGECGQKYIPNAERIQESCNAVDNNSREVGEPCEPAETTGITDRHTHAPDDRVTNNQDGSVVGENADNDQPGAPEPVWLQTPDKLGPIAEVADAGEEEVTSSGEQIEAHGDEKEEAQCGARIARCAQQKPEDQGGDEIDERSPSDNQTAFLHTRPGEGGKRARCMQRDDGDGRVAYSLMQHGGEHAGKDANCADGRSVVEESGLRGIGLEFGGWQRTFHVIQHSVWDSKHN